MPPRFHPTLSEVERALIAEEESILDAVLGDLAAVMPPGESPDFTEDILALRDSLGEARPDEVAQIVTQMDSLTVLSTALGSADHERPFDLASPYFGHLRLRQGGREMHVLVGTRALLSGKTPYPIIDWRNAPISKLYYTYREGEEYEEEFAGRMVEGQVLAHRRVVILRGRLMRVDCIQGSFQLSGEQWVRFDKAAPRLAGGEGSAVRSTTVEGLRLGVERLGLPGAGREERLLRAITGLLDPAQFDLITRPESGIVVVDGGAGSGKTTIALHRIAYLAYRSPERFQPGNMMVVVFNKALARYISALLPALGVEGVRIEVFEEFTGVLRRRHFPSLKGDYSDASPFSVVRFKQHPAALTMIGEAAEARAAEVRDRIVAEVARTDSEEKAARAWDSLEATPLAMRLALYLRWVAGKEILPGIGGFGADWLAQGRLATALREVMPNPEAPERLAATLWEEAFLHIERLREAADRLCPGEFTPGQLEEIRDWCAEAYRKREDARNRSEAGGGEPKSPEGDDEQSPDHPELDPEDDTLLLLTHTLVVGPLRNRRRNPLRVAHLMIDEAQDFSPLDIRLMMNLAAAPRSVTLAGDTDQRMMLAHGFDTWEDVLRHLGLEGTAVSPLQVGYRSTEEIMHFSKHVLGPLATERPWIPTRSGAPVTLLRFTNPGQAVAQLSEALHALLREEPNAYVALVARYPAQADLYHQGLALTDLPRLQRVNDQNFTFQRGVDVTDVTQVKGLEFDYVVLLDVDRHSYPDEPSARYHLHIGATRAAHQLWLVTCHPPSPLLPDDLEQQVL